MIARSPRLILLLVLLAVAAPPARAQSADDADAALAELLAYRWHGAGAARATIEMVDRIVAGGERMLPKIDEALKTVPDWKYTVGSWQAAHREGILSSFPTLRAALVEAASRIGGDRAVEILIRQASVQGNWRDVWVDRFVAVLYLSNHADRADVRDYYGALVRGFLHAKQDDSEMCADMRVVRGHLDPEMFEPLAAGFRAGWARRGGMDVMATALVGIDRARAGRLLLDTLGDPAAPGSARAAAARVVGRLPECRAEAVETVLKFPDSGMAGLVLGGMSQGRYGESTMELSARLTGDLDAMRAYTAGRIADLEECVEILDRFAAELGPKRAKELHFAEWRKNFEVVLADGRATLAALDAAIGARDENQDEKNEKGD